MSGDGGWRAEAIDAPPSLRLTGPAARARELPAASLDGRRPSRITDIVVASARRSFIVAFESLPELWEVSFDPDAPPVYDGMIHDWRMVEAISVPGFLHPRRMPLASAFSTAIDRLSTPDGAWVLARLRPSVEMDAAGVGCSHLALINLDARRVVAQWRLLGEADVAGARSMRNEAGPPARFALSLRRDGVDTVRMLEAPRGVMGAWMDDEGCR